MKNSKGNPIRIVMAVWVCILGALLIWLDLDTRRSERALALTSANAIYQQVVLSRLWNASHGAVYVPITATTQPNPYLPLQGRDLTADNGLKLTRINPAYMTRQLAEIARKDADGIQFHITSLKPIRPENKASEWEEKWLKSFEQGTKEQGEFFKDGQKTWFRYMAPLRTGPECLNCHAQQGYRAGDIRGGLSISLPYPSHSHTGLFVGFGALAAISLLIIYLCGTLYERKRLLFDATFNSPLPTCVTDGNHVILRANESYLAVFGALPDNQAIKCYEHRPGKSCHTERCPLTQIKGGSNNYVCETSKEREGTTRHFIVSAKPLLNAKGKVVGIVETFQEITEHKRAEETLAASNRLLETLSITDGLTGIANRRHFDEVLKQEYGRHARSGAMLSLIMLDIDHFKAFNDFYGHINGDKCLQQVAQVITACLTRPPDVAARYGGEEFVCILPETDSKGAVAVAEKIRTAIIARAIPHQGSKVAAHLTVSLGVATVQYPVTGPFENIVALADQQLYLAKSTGRNQVKFVAVHKIRGTPQGNLVQLSWKVSFCCGNQLIDSQHQSLMHVANELLEAVVSARPNQEISALIKRLIDEVGQHFKDEEKILAAADFPGLDRHAEKHAKLIARAHELSEQFQTSTLTVGDLFQFLAHDMVMRHMLEDDQEYFPFIGKVANAGDDERNGITD